MWLRNILPLKAFLWLTLHRNQFRPRIRRDSAAAKVRAKRPRWVTVECVDVQSTEHVAHKWICCDSFLFTQEAQLSQRDRATRYVSCQLLHNRTKIPSEKVCNRWTTLKVTQGHRKCHYFIGHTSLHFLLVVCSSNNVSILHRFRGIITVTVYVTTVTLRSPSVSIRLLELQSTYDWPLVC